MRRVPFHLAVGVATVLAAACASTPEPLPERSRGEEYRLGAEDVIEVSVHQAESLSRVLPVRPDGRVGLPLVGEVQAAGKTAGELGAELQAAYGRFVNEPRVTVIVREINAPRVYVVGEVGHPGAFPLRGDVNVVQAVALAGGFGPFASRSSMVLIRHVDGVEHRQQLDYDAMVEDGKIPLLAPGDTLVVP